MTELAIAFSQLESESPVDLGRSLPSTEGREPRSEENAPLSKEEIAAEDGRYVFHPELEEYISNIFNKLLDAYDGPVELPDIKIKLIDAGAGAMASISASHIFIDKNLFEEVQYEDELALVLGHELAHFIYRYDKNPKEPSTYKASVEEETKADYIGQNLAIEAGYSRYGAVSLIQRYIEEASSANYQLPRFIQMACEVVDEHLDNYTRLVNFKKDFLGAERLLTGDINLGIEDKEFTRLPDWVKPSAAGLKHVSFVAKLCKENSFETMTLLEKMVFFKDHLTELYTNARLVDLSEIVPHPHFIKVGIPDNPELEKAAHELFDYIMDNGQEVAEKNFYHSRQLFQTLYELCDFVAKEPVINPEDDRHDSQYSVRAIGRFRETTAAVHGFNESKTCSEALKHARKYFEGSTLFEQKRNLFFPYVNYELFLPRVDISKNSTPEHRMIKWCSEDESGTLIHFLAEYRFRYKSEQLFDHLPLATLENYQIQFTKETGHGLSNYLEARKEFSKIIIPPRKNDLVVDSEKWIETYSQLLNEIGFSDRKYSKFHPYHEKSREEKLAIHTACWEVLCSYFSDLIEHDPSVSIYKMLPEAPELRSRNISASKLPPLARFLYEHPETFSSQERLALGIKMYDYHNSEDMEKYAHAALPKDFNQLESFLKNNYGNEGTLIKIAGYQERDSICNYAYKLFISIADSELKNGVQNISNNCRKSAVKCVALLPEIEKRMELYSDLSSSISSLLIGEYNQDGILDEEIFKNLPAAQVIELYHILNDGRYFSDAVIRRQWGLAVIDAIGAEQDLEKRFYLYQDILNNEQARSSRILDLTVRNQLVENFADTIKEILKTPDNDTEEYKQSVFHLGFGNLNCRLSAAVRRRLCSAMAEKLQAQRSLAYGLREKCKLTPDEIHKASLPTKACEEVVKSASREPEIRTKFLKWITSDGGEKSTEVFREALLDESNYNGCFAPDLNMLIPDGDNNDSSTDQILNRMRDFSSDKIKKLHLTILRDLYDNFADQDQEVQTVFLKHVLIPAREDYELGEAAIWNNCKILLDQLFPLEGSTLELTEHKNSLWVRELVTTLLEVSHESERGFILGAIASSARASNADAVKKSTGQLIRGLLINLGPAYIKLGQAMHSSDSTPPDIQEHLLDLKGNVDKYLVWKTWELIDDLVKDGHMPEATESEIHHLQQCVGAASIKLVYYYQTPRQELRALGLIRRHALPLADKGFQSMSGITTKAECLRPYRAEALKIIAHARKLAVVETDTEIGSSQVENQCQQYNGSIVKVGGVDIAFKSRKWLNHGPGWQTMEAATGQVFDKLREDTTETKKHKDSIATAILIHELVNILRGQQFDYNRHERQYLVDKNIVYPIDAGGMSLSPPSEEDKKELGEAIGKFIGHLSHGSMNTTQAIQKVWSNSSDSDYLHQVREAVLYLSFTFKRLDSDQLKTALLAALSSKELDTTIERSIRSELSEHNITVPFWLNNSWTYSLVAKLKKWPEFKGL